MFPLEPTQWVLCFRYMCPSYSAKNMKTKLNETPDKSKGFKSKRLWSCERLTWSCPGSSFSHVTCLNLIRKQSFQPKISSWLYQITIFHQPRFKSPHQTTIARGKSAALRSWANLTMILYSHFTTAKLVGGWTNPSEKILLKLDHFPRDSG